MRECSLELRPHEGTIFVVSDMDTCFRSEGFKDIASSNLRVPLPSLDCISIGEIISKSRHDFLSKHDLDTSAFFMTAAVTLIAQSA